MKSGDGVFAFKCIRTCPSFKRKALTLMPLFISASIAKLQIQQMTDDTSAEMDKLLATKTKELLG